MLLYGTLLDHWCFMNLVLKAICLFGNWNAFWEQVFFFWNLGQELWYSELEEGEHRRRAEAQNIGGWEHNQRT